MSTTPTFGLWPLFDMIIENSYLGRDHPPPLVHPLHHSTNQHGPTGIFLPQYSFESMPNYLCDASNESKFQGSEGIPGLFVRWVFLLITCSRPRSKAEYVTYRSSDFLDPQLLEVRILWIMRHMHIPFTLKANRPCMCGVVPRGTLTYRMYLVGESSSNTTDFWYGLTHLVCRSGPFSNFDSRTE
jgi:hypothetical protein